jgi:lysophospholipase L1-like esterase
MDTLQPGPPRSGAGDGPQPERRGSRQRPAGGRRWRGVAFRIAAVMLSLTPLVLVESGLTALDLGRPDAQVDPFVGFRSVRPLFVLNPATGRREIPRSRQTFFRPESFEARKDPNEFRVFCLGGSTVQGRPFAIETSFTTWLEIGLRAADPSHQWEVVNCGGVSYASYRLVPILQEVLRYSPDLVIVYTGHNEFLEDRSYADLKHLPAVVTSAQELLLQSRSYSLLCSGYHRLQRQTTEQRLLRRPVLAEEVQALLDYRGGLDAYHWDDDWHRNVIRHFGHNLGRMVQLARHANVPIMLCNPVSNIRDCPPFKVAHRNDLQPEELRQWNGLCRAARDCYRVNKFQAIELYRKALAIDDQHAGLHYSLGECYDDLGQFDAARAAYLKAQQLDVCPLRMLQPMHRAVLQIARQTATPLVDVRQLIEQCSRDGIPGRDWLIDHVHPTILGHQRIADALLDRLITLDVVQPTSGWQARRGRDYQEHLASLDRHYDEVAMERLRRLRRWTEGRARRVRPVSHEATTASTTGRTTPGSG